MTDKNFIKFLWDTGHFWKGGPSETTMRRYFGGQPINVPNPDPIPTPVPTLGEHRKVYVTLEIDDSQALPSAKVIKASYNPLLV